MTKLALSTFLLTTMMTMSGCVVHTHDHDRAGYNEGYREGYYDREHNRWWHENAWRDCEEQDIHCR